MTAVLLAGTFMLSLLAGCGAKPEATDQETNAGEDTVITEESALEDDTVSLQNETEEAETASEEVKADEDVSYTEHEFFYVRDKLDMTDATPMDMNDLDVEGKNYTLKDSVNIYATSKGALKGYTKPNIDVYVNSCNEDWYCLYFENEESPNDYVLVKAEDFIASTGIEIKEKVLITLDDVRKCFMEEINDWEHEDSVTYEMLDSVSADMESVEFKLPKYYSDSDTLQLDSWMEQMQVKNNLLSYKEFYIEPIEDEADEEYSWFRVYYKDLQEFAQ